MRLAKCESQIGMPEKKAIRFCDSQPDSQRCVRVRSLRGRCLRVCKNELAISEWVSQIANTFKIACRCSRTLQKAYQNTLETLTGT
ncbi:hypothetical protein NDU88_003937 [Pleurodeles waltl]|uniref:Uncharacterized protein n=1 Tax=Pleurodeles waltl TaxID=8319 RepID=A0AAV7M7R2_PLEWA|nr:hypothetical protein NDU88_003937 [Pleurodeles waltl]